MEVVCGVCTLGCGDIVRGVCKNNVVIITATSFPPSKFEFSQKALRNPKVEFAKSRSRFGHYIRWSDITKVL